MNRPLIMTLALEKTAAEFFTAQRTRYFPKHINFLKAHLTLFHALPFNEPRINETITTLSTQATVLLFHQVGCKP
jgi:hypothetical protein